MGKAELEASLNTLDIGLIVFGVLVAIGVVGESVFGFLHWRRSNDLHALQIAENTAQQVTIARLQNDTALTEERLLSERRLTATERWRLERVEHAALGRITFFDFNRLAAELKAAHFGPVNLVIVNRPEPRAFGFALMDVLQQAGMAGPFLLVPENGEFAGLMVAVQNDEGQRLQNLLWTKFKAAGNTILPTGRPISERYPELAALPKGTNSLIVGENDAGLQPGDGQPGEGLDQHDGADPAPH